ncbi:AAC(3) family N-acetyltransferase [Thiofilum flexile]|uniref:AAC(3) family N-acetyltransferase n=1 Tax=Thiofilum flexile TaxID=125627 RepID=UPI00035DC270|nr:AAC(3) family N-acetyltransferase [Thiofilum flexile]
MNSPLNNLIYTQRNILDAYERVGVSAGKTVYITGNFGRPGLYENKGKDSLLNAHYSALRDLIGSQGTLVVPTHSWSLCNTDKVFDPAKTPSETGIFTEFLRKKEGSIRQLHPFSSSTAHGYKAEYFCTNNSRHVYGPQSPFSRMIDEDALYVSVGKEIETTASIVHHLEFMMGVPYRYVKEFMHPCIIGTKKTIQPWYLYVLYNNINIVRDRNRKIFDIFRKEHTVNSIPLGNSFIESFSMRDFYNSLSIYFSSDLYLWLNQEPFDKPYQR